MVTETLKKYTGTLWRHNRNYLRHPTNSLWSHPIKKGPHFKGSLIEDTYQGAMISVITANMAPTFLSPGSAPEQLSSEVHPDRQQQMGCAKQLCVVWCVTIVSLLQGRKPTRLIFLWQNLPALWRFYCIYISSDRNRKDQRLSARRCKKLCVLVRSQGTEHPQCTRESVAAGNSPSPQCYR